MWIWPSNPVDLVFRKLSISQFPPTAVPLSLSLPVLLFTTAASCGGQVAALSCCEETTTGRAWRAGRRSTSTSASSSASSSCCLLISSSRSKLQAVASAVLNPFAHWPSQIKGQIMRRVQRLSSCLLLDMQLPPRSRNGSWTNISRRLTVRLKPVSTSDPPPIPIPCAWWSPTYYL